MLRNLAAGPFWLAATLAGLVSPPLAVTLYKHAWRVSRNSSAGMLALAKLRQSGDESSALLEARRMLEHRPSPDIAAFAGLMELDAGLIAEADANCRLAQRLGGDADGLTELLEFRIVAQDGANATRTWELARRLEQRRDVSPTVSRLAIQEMMWSCLMAGEFDEARRRAALLLEVANDPLAEIVAGVLADRDGKRYLAKKHFARTASLPAKQRLYYRWLASHAVGDPDADALLSELRQVDASLADQAARLKAAREAQP